MPTFDQKNQQVNYQYNAAGNINFGAVNSAESIPNELRKLLKEVVVAIQAGAIDDEKGVDAKSHIEKAVIQAEKRNPDKQNIINNLNGAKLLIESVVSATSLISGIVQAAEMVKRVL